MALLAPLCPAPQLPSGPGLVAASEASFELEAESEDPLSEIPAAVSVLTGDEIRRARHTSLQAALHMVPGFNVARYRTSGWSVSARGSSGGCSNQLLIMIDGVSVYTPLFAGTWWELQDLNMADSERVEIVRGPGGSLWGANAVNGVVNVITKHADDTLDTSLNLTYGADERMGPVRYGQKLDNGAFRVWAKGSNHNPLLDSNDDWQIFSAGFRTDTFFSDTDESTPNNQVNVRSYYDLNDKWELDEGFYYVDSVPYFGTPSYTRVDLRLGYQPTSDWRFSVGVQNLNAKRHPEESENEVGFGSEVIRSVYFTLA